MAGSYEYTNLLMSDNTLTEGQRAVRDQLTAGPKASDAIADEIDITASAVRGRVARMDSVEKVGEVNGRAMYGLASRDHGEAESAVRGPEPPADGLPKWAIEQPTSEVTAEGGAGPPADEAGRWEAEDAETSQAPAEGEDVDEVPEGIDPFEYFAEAQADPQPQPPVRTDRSKDVAQQSQTRAATEALQAIERQGANVLTEARRRYDLAPKPQGKRGEVDVLVPRADDHFGAQAKAYDHDSGQVMRIFDLDIAVERVRECTRQVVDKVTKLQSSYDFGTCHYALMGDSVTGECIYNSQPHEIDATLREQMNTAADVYFEELSTLAEIFDHVHVPTVPGNHGEIRIDTPAPDNNADDFVYDRLETMVRVSDLDNVSFTRSWRAKFVNYEVRGWSVHARHGQDSLEHIGTSSGKNRWRGWLDGNDFDFAMRGHYHEKKREPVRGRPVLESGSISPPEEFEESLAEYSPPGSMFYFIGDGRSPIESAHDIDFEPIAGIV